MAFATGFYFLFLYAERVFRPLFPKSWWKQGYSFFFFGGQIQVSMTPVWYLYAWICTHMRSFCFIFSLVCFLDRFYVDIVLNFHVAGWEISRDGSPHWWFYMIYVGGPWKVYYAKRDRVCIHICIQTWKGTPIYVYIIYMREWWMYMFAKRERVQGLGFTV